MESTRTYHLPIERYFKRNNFNEIVINGLSSKNNFNSLSNLCFSEYELIFKNSKIFENTVLNFIQAFPYAYIVKKKN